MPLQDTPWGSMRQARSAQHTSGNVPRPPRPSYLPPPPPKCSVSPLPPTLCSIGKSGEESRQEAELASNSDEYDHISVNGHDKETLQGVSLLCKVIQG